MRPEPNERSGRGVEDAAELHLPPLGQEQDLHRPVWQEHLKNMEKKLFHSRGQEALVAGSNNGGVGRRESTRLTTRGLGRRFHGKVSASFWYIENVFCTAPES